MYVPSESFIISERQMIMNTVIHPIPPVFDRNSKILILGSFPSVKSREGHFFYHHPQNRFWKTLAGVLDVPVPDTIAEKKAFLLSHRIALWDVIASCSIEGSSDSSIRDFFLRNEAQGGDPEKAVGILDKRRNAWIEATEKCMSEKKNMLISVILSTADIRAIFCNGKTSWNYYRKYQEAVTGIPAVSLPSTSPANAAWSLEKLKGAWNVILPYIR